MNKILKTFKESFKRESIKLEELNTIFSRSSGPGGQNVNKVNTKVEIRLNLPKASFLPPEVKDIVRKELSNRINKNDDLIVGSDRFRTQRENFQDCLTKIYSLINDSIQLPGETSVEKTRRIDNLQKKFKAEVLRQKRIAASKKAHRRGDERS